MIKEVARRGKSVDWRKEHLTFKALEQGTFKCTKAVQYSINKGEWVSLAASTDTPTLNQGDTIRWRATAAPSGGLGTFSATCDYDAMGNPLSMSLGDNFVGVTTMPNNNGMFANMFYQDTHIKSAKNMMLVCTTLRSNCYENMFRDSSVTYSPYIACSSFPSAACSRMFLGCSSLAVLQPFTIASATMSSFQYAFQDCTALAHAPIKVTHSGNIQYQQYFSMFQGCSALIDAMEELPSKVSYKGYNKMFYGCTSLTRPPRILAESDENGMLGMFQGCVSLVEPPEIHVTSFADGYSMRDMFANCVSLVRMPDLPAKSANVYSYAYMFQGCTQLTKTSTIAATSNGDAYSGMFQDCSKLSYIRLLVEGTNLNYFSFSNGVARNGTFVKSPNATWQTGIRGIPTGWTVLEAVQITVTYTGDNSGAYLKEIGGSEIIHTFIDGEAYEADLDDAKSYGVYDSGDNLIQTLATPYSRTVNITI